jgi:hypothetical protein
MILLIGILLTYNPNTSLAAPSGGRMGGRAFSKSSSSSSSLSPEFSSSSSSSSRSYSVPSPSPDFSYSASYYEPSSSSSWSRRSYSRVSSPPSPEFSYSAEPSPFRVEPAVDAEVDSDFNFFISILAGFSPLYFLLVFLPLIYRFLSDRDDGSVLTNTAAGKTTVLKLQVIYLENDTSL